MDLTDTIIPKSDQLNAEDLLAGPRTFTITEVRQGGPEQPVNIHTAEMPGRPFRPSKTVRRILVTAWGADSDAYIGRRLTVYRDPKVKWAGEEIGGIRVSHLSHITAPMKLALAVTKNKREPYIIQPLKDDAPPAPDYVADAEAATSLAEWRQVWERAKAAGHLTDALKARLVPIGKALDTKPADQPQQPTLEDEQ